MGILASSDEMHFLISGKAMESQILKNFIVIPIFFLRSVDMKALKS
jgi:hypothetical protein